jgi:hypothetical protein
MPMRLEAGVGFYVATVSNKGAESTGTRGSASMVSAGISLVIDCIVQDGLVAGSVGFANHDAI